jgi:serine/threonine protein kinase
MAKPRTKANTKAQTRTRTAAAGVPAESGGGSVPRMLGHYEVLEKIGQGGMAVVYRGVQPSLNRQVAIKVLPQQFARSPELLARFEREANIVAKLNHSNIVQVIDRGKERDVLFIVMEYVEGENLGATIQRAPMPIGKVLDLAGQICDALEYAHNQGIVHRDLKPSNILIEARTGRPKIADFGIACLETEGGEVATLTTGSGALGTLNYMAPEQRMDSHNVKNTADLFSFGVILYEMLTGQLPIGHFKLPSLIRPDVPIGLDEVVKKCLANHPEDRYANAREVREELARFTRRHTSMGERLNEIKAMLATRTFAERRRVLCMAGGIAAIVIAGVTVMLVGASRSKPPQTETTNALPPAVSQEVDTRFLSDYKRARQLLSERNFAAAHEALTGLLRDHPRHAMAADVQFALAGANEGLGQVDQAVVEYNTLTRAYPGSGHVPRALVALCRIDVGRQPRIGMWRNQWDADFQSRMIRRLSEIERDHPEGDHLVELQRLIVEVAAAPRLNDLRTAAEALLRLAKSDPSTAPDSLLRAATIYSDDLNDAAAAKGLFVRIVQEHGQSEAAAKARSRVEKMK